MKSPVIITLGPDGTYSSIAAQEIAANAQQEVTIRYKKSLAHILNHIDSHHYGLIPIENLYEGIVHPTMMPIYEHRNSIRVIGWITLRIDHCLAGVGDMSDVGQIKKIYAHPQSLGQCKEKLSTLYGDCEQISTSSNTSQVEELQKEEAVICSLRVAKKLNLSILDDSMCPPDNATKFALMGHRDAPDNILTNILENDRAIIVISLSDAPGALNEILTIISKLGLSLHFLSSVPNGKFKYNFPIVIDRKNHALEKAAEEIRSRGLGDMQIL